MRIVLRALALACTTFVLTGCGTSTRYVTPWLRTTTHRDFEIIA